jgi:hypothetical protein
MSRCQPAVFMVPKRGGVDVPPVADVVDTAREVLEAAGWSNPSDILIDAREGELEIQDEVPPAPPVDVYGVALVFSQTEATFQYGYEGPFREVLEGLADEYPEQELWISAVPSPGGGGA